MRRPLFPAILSVLITLAVLAACSDPAPTPETAVAPTTGTIAATAPPPGNTPEPTATVAPTATPTPPPTSNPAPSGVLTSPPTTDLPPVISSLSEAEFACIGGDPERMIAALTGGSPASLEEQARLIGCLDDDTVDLISLSTIIPVPLSMETSDCILAGLDVIDPRGVMAAGLEGDPQSAMAGSMAAFTVSIACLNDGEWRSAATRLGMVSEDREGARCLMEILGGPGQMAEAMSEREDGVDTLSSAVTTCGLAMMSPEPRPEFATPTPMPTAIVETPTVTATPTSPLAKTTTLVITVADIPAGIPEYDRSEWRHWVDADGDCRDARQEVLIAESLEPVEYEDDRQCRVESGRW